MSILGDFIPAHMYVYIHMTCNKKLGFPLYMQQMVGGLYVASPGTTCNPIGFIAELTTFVGEGAKILIHLHTYGCVIGHCCDGILRSLLHFQ